MRSLRSGRIHHRAMRDVAGREVLAPLRESIVVNEPAAMREAALLDLGGAMLVVPDVLPALDGGRLIRPLPRWYCDAGAICRIMASNGVRIDEGQGDLRLPTAGICSRL